LLALLVLFSALMDLAPQKDNAHLPTAALRTLHLNAPAVTVLTQQLETAQSLNAHLMLQLSASTVSVLRATSSVSLPSLTKMPRPAPMNQTATSFLALMADVSALQTSADLSSHAQVVKPSAAMTEAAELLNLNALRARAALLVEATDAQAVFAPKTLLTAHNLMAAQHSPAQNAHSQVTAPSTRLFARQSITPPSFQTTALPDLLTSAQVVTALLTRTPALRSETALMVNTSAQTKSADLSGDLTHSSQNLLKITA
jgi:hypothetical protein